MSNPLGLPVKEPTMIDLTLAKYHKAIEITPELQKELLSHGETEPITSQLGMDKMLKKNYLLQYAMENPKEYIKKRTNMLEKIKTDVDQEFINVFKEYSTGENKLPTKEAKEMALKSAQLKMENEIIKLEMVLPSSFGMTAYEKAINDQIARKHFGVSEKISTEK